MSFTTVEQGQCLFLSDYSHHKATGITLTAMYRHICVYCLSERKEYLNFLKLYFVVFGFEGQTMGRNLSLCLFSFPFQEITMDGPIFSTITLECPAITPGPSPMCAVSTDIVVLYCIYCWLICVHKNNSFYYSRVLVLFLFVIHWGIK